MPQRILIVASLAALLTLAPQAPAQQQNQPAIPDAPQPQKKPAPKPPPQSSGTSTDSSPADSPAPAAAPDPSIGKNDNAFPEAVSRDAAAKAAQDEKTPADGSSAAQEPDAPEHSTSTANPFPEDISRGAAKAAGNDASTPSVPGSDLPPGVSSSQSQGSIQGKENGQEITDPVLAKKDTDIGSFYLKTGNYQGALQRFKDASAADSTDIAAIFGLAESQRMLGKTADAARNYQLYLDIVPNGPSAKEAIKALKALQARK